MRKAVFWRVKDGLSQRVGCQGLTWAVPAVRLHGVQRPSVQLAKAVKTVCFGGLCQLDAACVAVFATRRLPMLSRWR